MDRMLMFASEILTYFTSWQSIYFAVDFLDMRQYTWDTSSIINQIIGSMNF